MHAVIYRDVILITSPYHCGITEHACELPEPGNPESGPPFLQRSIERTIDHQLANAPWLNPTEHSAIQPRVSVDLARENGFCA